MPVNRFRADRVGPPPLPLKPKAPANLTQAGTQSFADHLKRACEEVDCRTKFSGHARERVDTRGIDLNSEQLLRLDRAIDSAMKKGANKALVMLDDTALIVGVNNRTVVTIVDRDGLKENVFTAIDSAIIA